MFKLDTPRMIHVMKAPTTYHAHRLARVRLWLAASWLALLNPVAEACTIERNNVDIVTIRGTCDQALLLSQLKIAVRQMEARSEAREKLVSEAEAPDSPARKIDLVNGQAKGSARTFFHRSPAKK